MITDPAEAWTKMQYDTSIAVDLETSGLNRQKDKIAVVSISGQPSGETAVIHNRGSSIPDPIKAILNTVPLWLTHNGTNFDLPFLKNWGVKSPPSHYDTLVGEQVLATQDRNKTLKNLGATMKRRLGKNFKDDADHSLWMRENLSEDQLSYCINDVAYLHLIKLKHEELCHERNLSKALTKEQELSSIVTQVVQNGLPFDESRLEELLAKQEEESELANIALTEKFGETFNVMSPKQVMKALNSIELYPPTTEKVELLELKEYSPYPDYILSAKLDRRMHGMFKQAWLDEFVHNGRVYSNFWQLGARTTRFTSSDPNLQQIPRIMREIIGGEPGKKVIAADYSQIEVWITAHLAEEPKLVSALLSEDFHAFMAQVGFNLKEVSSLQRTQGKGGTFTWCFAGGADGIIGMGRKAGKAVSRDVANRMLASLNKRFPGVHRLHIRLRKQARRNIVTVMKLPWGHQRILIPPVYATTMMNTSVQGRAAIGFKEGLFECHKSGLTPYIGGLLHDETIASGVPEKEAENFRVEMVECLIKGMRKICDLPIFMGSTLRDSWIKD